jgi:hypothetical protein
MRHRHRQRLGDGRKKKPALAREPLPAGEGFWRVGIVQPTPAPVAARAANPHGSPDLWWTLNPRQSRPCILNGDMMHDLYTLLEEAPEMYSTSVRSRTGLHSHMRFVSDGISKTALHRNILDAGITYKLLRRAAAERDEDLWQEWKQDVNTNFMASQMVFIDETSKDDQ